MSQEHVLTVGRLKAIMYYIDCFKQLGDEKLYRKLIKAVGEFPQWEREENHNPFSGEFSSKYYSEYHESLPGNVRELIEETYRSMLPEEYSE